MSLRRRRPSAAVQHGQTSPPELSSWRTALKQTFVFLWGGFTGGSHLWFSKHINDNLMAVSLACCSVQICFSVRAQLVVVLIVACRWALQNQTEFDFCILGYKHLCQSVFVCSNSVIPVLLSSSQPGAPCLFACMSKCLRTHLCMRSYRAHICMCLQLRLCVFVCSSHPILGQSWLASNKGQQSEK